MLVLSRKLNETIQISEDISITVTQIGRARVRLAIVAPDHVRIRRSELLRHTETRDEIAGLCCEPELCGAVPG